MAKVNSAFVRIPENKTWKSTDVSGPAQTTDDQQYHYDRILKYLDATNSLIDDIETVKEDPKDFAEGVSKGMEDSIGKLGCLPATSLAAVSDYINHILLKSKKTPAKQGTSVQNAYAKSPDVISYLQTNFQDCLNDIFYLNIFCEDKPLGKSEQIIITDKRVLIIPEKRKGWSVAPPISIPISGVSSVLVGDDVHTEYQGISSTTIVYWTLTFVCTNYAEYTRYLYLGTKESEMNQNRPILMERLNQLGKIFELEEGSSYESSDGYTTSFGVGFWV